MTRAVVNVATTPAYQKGQERLRRVLGEHNQLVQYHTWHELPAHWPAHEERQYAFKAFALREAVLTADLVIWADACILPIRSMEPLWERIERDGAVIVRNGYPNSMWCCDSWYADCFPGVPLEEARAINRGVEHVVATCFGLNVKHPVGRAILDEYFYLASETQAFCGPWINSFSTPANPAPRTAICGPQEVKGHRHDQSCLSIIAHRLGVKLIDSPDIFAYGKAGDTFDECTILVADGTY